MNDDQETIVAEISKTWMRDQPRIGAVLAQRFEMVIDANKERGYALDDWRFNQIAIPETPGEWPAQLVETIIAVFKKAPSSSKEKT